MKSHEIRKNFIDYFAKNKHQEVASSSLVPEGDSTLLFTNAGMNQFKNTFLGLENRPYTRAASSQKCVRAGGKHNDLENVGQTARHHTFFEMLGNFSFGDYFKKDAIHFAWEFITKELQLPKDKLYVTVFEKDDEAADIWMKQEGVPQDRIYRFGEKDNFWRMGDTGPCGPCSEIFYDLGPSVPGNPKDNVMGGEGDRFMEFWNLVFMQYEDFGNGNLKPLPNPSIDTGMGLERLTTILQGQINNYHTDVFMDIIHAVEKVSKKSYVINGATDKTAKDNMAFRVLADHARAVSFLIADGVLPSNEGRGYVLRRILRRAIRFGHQLNERDSLLLPAVQANIQKMGGHYSELKAQQKLIEMTVKDEESRFLTTLEQGLRILEDALNSSQTKNKTLNGEVAFKLYDTFGFPVDLTRLIAKEKGFEVDEKSFEAHVEQAKDVARKSWKGAGITANQAFLTTWTQKISDKNGATEFTGYDSLRAESSKVLALSDLNKDVTELTAGQEGLLIVNKTPFYAEGGGQVGDQGMLKSNQGATAEVLDCNKQNDLYLHRIKVLKGTLKISDTLELMVKDSDRRDTANNHSATHLLHWALRATLGDHVTQAGSLVAPDRLRFDFTHNKPLSPDEIQKIEKMVNDQIQRASSVHSEVLPQKEALKKGAVALFGEKYGDKVRVIAMGDSVEFCGGTHVTNTSQILTFKVLSESGVSSGVRRIEALTGVGALAYLNSMTTQAQMAREKLGLSKSGEGAELMNQLDGLQNQIKNLKKEIQGLKGSSVNVEDLIKRAEKLKDVEGQWVCAVLEVDDRKVLSDLSDQLRDKLSPAVVVLMGQGQGSYPLLVSVTKSLNSKIKAGDILKNLAESLGGKGGGRPDFAQGAVPKLPSQDELNSQLKNLLS